GGSCATPAPAKANSKGANHSSLDHNAGFSRNRGCRRMYPAQLQPPNGLDPVSTRIEDTLKAMLLRGLYAARKIAVNSAKFTAPASSDAAIADGIGFGVPGRAQKNDDG